MPVKDHRIRVLLWTYYENDTDSLIVNTEFKTRPIITHFASKIVRNNTHGKH